MAVRPWHNSDFSFSLRATSPGKNPYEGFDPLNLADDSRWAYKPTGGEWECVCDVSARGAFRSFQIRPKALSRHGRQWIKVGKDTVMNVGNMSKLKSMSFRPHFVVGRGTDESPVYKCVSDIVGRTVSLTNERDELVAVMAKTKKALIQNAVFGTGSESTIDIAPGVDCSTVLMIVYGLGQVGEHCESIYRPDLRSVSSIFYSKYCSAVSGANSSSIPRLSHDNPPPALSSRKRCFWELCC